MAFGALLHGIPAWLMLPVIISAGQNELTLIPDDLGTQMEVARSQAIANNTGKKTCVPDIGHIAGE